jgi:hypothetical protein
LKPLDLYKINKMIGVIPLDQNITTRKNGFLLKFHDDTYQKNNARTSHILISAQYHAKVMQIKIDTR